MQVLPVIIPYIQTTSNLALSCHTLRDWLSNNGFQIKSSRGDLTLENLSFYQFLERPGLGWWMRSEIFVALKEDRADHLKLLLEHGADPDPDEYGMPALIRAVTENKTEHMKLLLEYKADIEAEITDIEEIGGTALIHAAYHKNTDYLELLLEHKANIEAKNHVGESGLMYAAMYGPTECLGILLEHGANPNAINNDGVTVLSYAAINDATDRIKMLLRGGAKVEPWVREKYPELWKEFCL